jgi:hypothetical protein
MATRLTFSGEPLHLLSEWHEGELDEFVRRECKFATLPSSLDTFAKALARASEEDKKRFLSNVPPEDVLKSVRLHASMFSDSHALVLSIIKTKLERQVKSEKADLDVIWAQVCRTLQEVLESELYSKRASEACSWASFVIRDVLLPAVERVHVTLSAAPNDKTSLMALDKLRFSHINSLGLLAKYMKKNFAMCYVTQWIQFMLLDTTWCEGCLWPYIVNYLADMVTLEIDLSRVTQWTLAFLVPRDTTAMLPGEGLWTQLRLYDAQRLFLVLESYTRIRYFRGSSIGSMKGADLIQTIKTRLIAFMGPTPLKQMATWPIHKRIIGALVIATFDMLKDFEPTDSIFQEDKYADRSLDDKLADLHCPVGIAVLNCIRESVHKLPPDCMRRMLVALRPHASSWRAMADAVWPVHLKTVLSNAALCQDVEPSPLTKGLGMLGFGTHSSDTNMQHIAQWLIATANGKIHAMLTGILLSIPLCGNSDSSIEVALWSYVQLLSIHLPQEPVVTHDFASAALQSLLTHLIDTAGLYQLSGKTGTAIVGWCSLLITSSKQQQSAMQRLSLNDFIYTAFAQADWDDEQWHQGFIWAIGAWYIRKVYMAPPSTEEEAQERNKQTRSPSLLESHVNAAYHDIEDQGDITTTTHMDVSLLQTCVQAWHRLFVQIPRVAYK